MKNKIRVAYLFSLFIFQFSFLIAQKKPSHKTENPTTHIATVHPPAVHQPPQTVRVLFIFDASFSMYDTWQKRPKIDIAKEILTEIIDSLRTVPNLQMGFRTLGADYSLYPERNCKDTRLVVPFGDKNAFEIEHAIKNIQPRGTTPIAYTLDKCADDFTPCSNCRDVILLITDGIEECGGDPCEVAKNLRAKGIILRPFVIGIGRENFADQYSCIGKFFDVKQEDDFRNVLRVVISQALNNSSAQVNLIDANGKPTETDVAMTFYDQQSGKRLYNFMHTLNDYGNPDTLYLDPNITYKLVVHTIPEIEKENINLTAGIHNIIPLNAAQGFLHIAMDGSNQYTNLCAIIRKHDEGKTLNVQTVESTEKYLTGKYDLEILTLPRIYESGVKITQSTTTSVLIPQAGTIAINKPSAGPSSIYEDDAGTMKWVCTLDPKLTKYNLTMEPGKYHIVFRSLDVKSTVFTIDKEFEIKSGASSNLNLE